jgi:ubiquinone/menaquinone biosynthesis C-methylase UbiE
MIVSYLKRIVLTVFKKREINPHEAYNLWAAAYDNQQDNLMLDLDEMVFSHLLQEMDIEEKQVADIGCGTGRHWPKIIAKAPGRLIGYDVSEEMLKKLKHKFPYTESNLLKDNKLADLEDESCDLLCSTLTIAHIPDVQSTLTEWNRVLKNGGDMIITDYHPVILQKGGRRTFFHDGKLVSIRNYIHPVDTLRQLARQLQLKEIRFMEKQIDESVKRYYEKKNALALYEKYKDLPVIYGIHFKKDR